MQLQKILSNCSRRRVSITLLLAFHTCHGEHFGDAWQRSCGSTMSENRLFNCRAALCGVMAALAMLGQNAHADDKSDLAKLAAIDTLSDTANTTALKQLEAMKAALKARGK